MGLQFCGSPNEMKLCAWLGFHILFHVWFSLQTYNALVIPIFGCMMMVGMRRKVKIISEEISGKRYVQEYLWDMHSNYSGMPMESFYKHFGSNDSRLQLDSSAPCSLCLYLKVSLMFIGMRLATIQLYQIISSRKGSRSFFYLDSKALGPALFSSR